MTVHAHLEQLAGPAHAAAADALVAAGEAAVAPLVAALEQEPPAIDPAVVAAVLRRIGPVAHGPLIRALAGAEPEMIAHRMCDALGMTVPDPRRAVWRAADIRTGDWDDRREVAEIVAYGREAEYAPMVAALLADPDPRVSAAAVDAFGRLGRETVPLLRRVRQARVPQRRGVRAALAAIGWDTLDPADHVVLRRFVDARLAAQTPAPCLVLGEWFALRTRDREAVLDAFGLSDPVPATLRMGTSAWLGDDRVHPYEDHSRCARMFVTPVLDGWTLVLGDATHTPDLAAHDEDLTSESPAGYRDTARRMREVVADLSRRFGVAHWYRDIKDSGCGDATGWCFAENGAETRFYHHDFDDDEIQAGTPDPAEEGLRPVDEDIADWLERNGFPRDLWQKVSFCAPDDPVTEEEQAEWDELVDLFKQRTNIPPLRTAATVAARASAGPASWGPHTRVEGHGVLALTACGRRHGHRGALPI